MAEKFSQVSLSASFSYSNFFETLKIVTPIRFPRRRIASKDIQIFERMLHLKSISRYINW